jgi:hypothetical protein
MNDQVSYHSRDKHAPPEYAHRVVPGMTRLLLAKRFAAQGFTDGAEIGVADGRNSLMLCQNIPGLNLLCVDPWLKYGANPRGGPQDQHDDNYRKARERLASFRATLVRAKSMDAVRDVPMASLDFVYLDGHHGYQFVLDDLTHWSQRVRPGGIVAGHDFYHFRNAGVVEAVDAYTKTHGIDEWFLCDEREPSFWWVNS